VTGSRPAEAGIRVALLHYGDVRNYGDVLFPILAARELRARLPSVVIDFVSPTGLGPEPGIRYDAARLGEYDAIVLAGGELVHRHDAVLSGIYRRFGLDAIESPTDLVFGWAGVPGPYKAWLGLGVPPLSARSRDAIVQAAPDLDMLVVRGSGSARRLRAAGVSAETGVDIGWLFSRLAGAQRPVPRPYVVLQALPTTAPDDLPLVVDPLRRLTAAGLEIVLLPLSTCWSDESVLARIADQSGFRLVDYRLSEVAKLEILGHCALYIGQSMHGFISTLAAGHPAGLCFPAGDDKFGELLADNGLEDCRVGTWGDLPALIARLLAFPPARVEQLRARTAARADAMFDALAEGIERHAGRRDDRVRGRRAGRGRWTWRGVRPFGVGR
jgi:polysaccharide pyruvyl transferase WcaK-like protein